MISKMFLFAGVSLALVAGVLLLLIGSWYLRDNQSRVNPALEAEVWPAVADGWHNANTHLAHWDGQFYLAHTRSRFHAGSSEARLVLRRSADGRAWEEVAVLTLEGEDLRDPKLLVLGDELFLYALANRSVEPEPYGTLVSTTRDGRNWSPLQPLDPPGWLLWEPKTLDGQTWYATAYWHEHGRSALFKSTDGIHWEHVSDIHDGDRNDETANEFLPDGRMIVTARLEGDDRAWHQGSPHASTLIAVAEAPYTTWSKTFSDVTRLDGPALFRSGDRVYAAGRFDPDGHTHWYGMSSVLGRKRTALYEVRPDGLTHLSDLPSAGDTSYAGAVIRDDDLYVSYYTSDPTRDVPWLLGLFLPSDILVARLPLANLEAVADAAAAP